MDLLSLDLIGWLFAAGSGIALASGIWLLGLVGGIGVLLAKSWSRPVLELFCWTLMILIFLSAWSRWRAAPPPRTMLTLSLAAFILPLIAVCVATIATLRGETALRVLSG